MKTIEEKAQRYDEALKIAKDNAVMDENKGEQKTPDMDEIKEKAHQIAWESSKHYDPTLSKESWCEMAALEMAYWLHN